MNTSQRPRGTTLLKWFGSLLSIALLIYLLSQQGWREIGQALSQIPLWRFVVVILLMLVSRLAVANRWHALLHATSVEITWKQSVRLTFAGLFATNFLPTTIGGDIVRLAGAVQSGLDGTVVAASLVADRLVGMFGMLLMVPLGIIPLLDWFSTARTGSGLLLAPSFLLVSGSVPKKIWQRALTFIQKTFQTLKMWWSQPLSLLRALLFTGIHMLCFFGILWVLLAGLNDPLPFGTVAGLYSFVYLVTLLPISINGYGLQELSISMIFSEVAGVSLQHSLTVALIFRTLTMLASLPGALFVPGIIAGRKSAFSRQEIPSPENDPFQSEVSKR